MYRVLVLTLFVVAGSSHRSAPQSPAPGEQQPDIAVPAQQPMTHQHEHGAMEPSGHADHEMQMEREGSGTAWLPEDTPMYSVHRQRGAWMLMAHGNAFGQLLHESGARGNDQFGSVNWFMGMAHRDFGPRRLMLRGMVSAEPWTIRGCGYPDLLASGERCRGERIHDRQHPHDFVMELSAEYDAPLTEHVRWQLYGGPAGEPALGPVAYPHRISSMPNPVAPISHHWLDSTHVAYGVVTGGVYGNRWKAEGSLFNGREPDEHRTNIEFGALDSVSGRVTFLPTSRLAIQFSTGRLTQAEAAEHGGNRTDVSRTTASVTYHAKPAENTIWATTIAWGRNDESGHGSNAFLVETSLTANDRDSWYGRLEGVEKTAHDLALDVMELDAFTVAKLQGGYTYYARTWRGLKPGIGAALSAAFVPDGLRFTYGHRVNTGFGVFLTLRPRQVSTRVVVTE